MTDCGLVECFKEGYRSRARFVLAYCTIRVSRGVDSLLVYPSHDAVQVLTGRKGLSQFRAYNKQVFRATMYCLCRVA